MRLALAAARAPLITVAILAALALVGGLLALSLQPSVADGTLVPSSSASYRATETDYREFGADAVVVLVREPLTDLLATQDLATVSELEACFAGQVLVPDDQLLALAPAPAGALPADGGRTSPCAMLMRYHPVQAVYGPGTFLNHAVAAVNEQLLSLREVDQTDVVKTQRRAYALALADGLGTGVARSAALSAGRFERERLSQQLEQLALQTGISGVPSIESQAFLSQIVFAQSHGIATPRAQLHYLFPTSDVALIGVRLQAGLQAAQVARAITWIREAAAMRRFRLRHGAGYTVTGEPVLVNDLAAQITAQIPPLLLGAIAVMGLSLALVFAGAVRLAPLAIALAAAAITFGLAALAGATLTMASVAVLPILIGLAVDYAIQFQSRARESSEEGEGAVADAARRGGPAIVAAALATAAGFLVLLLSPVPMVQGFGVLLVIGIVIALACTLSGGSAAIVLGRSDLGLLGASVLGAREILSGAWKRPRALRRLSGRPRATRTTGTGLAVRAARHPGGVLAVGLLLAIAGWIADARTPVQSDITKLVPANTEALRNLHELERASGSSGEIDVIVHAGDVATPATISWMSAYERRLLAHYGYLQSGDCADATLCPALSLPDLFENAGAGARTAAGSATADPVAPVLTRASIAALLAAVPRYFSQAVISGDRHDAVLAFGIRLMALSKQQQVIDYMRSQLHPPASVRAELAGLPVLAASANAALSSVARRLATLLAALIAVALVLALVLRSARRALVPLVPIALASGWSALIVFAIGIPLNPMSATLGALVIAISTEFSVLLSERYEQERSGGLGPVDALQRCYRTTGAAVLASGVTAIAGFGVLMASNITMLREFGFVTVIDLAVSLSGVLLVLPAVLALAGPYAA
ncbi:MAG: MMPL family transporter [Solirubrobacteraceae bacterium]